MSGIIVPEFGGAGFTYPGGGIFGHVQLDGSVAQFEVTEIYPGKRGKIFSFRKSREYVRKFRIWTDSMNVDEIQVITALGIRPYDLYYNAFGEGTGDKQALAGDFEAERELPDDWQTWIATITYFTDLPNSGPDDGLFPDSGANSTMVPWLEPAAYRWESEIDHKSPPKDLDGKAFVNAALQPFSPAPQFDTGYSILIIEKNLEVFDSALIQKYQFAVNEAPFPIPAGGGPSFPIGAAQCFPPTAIKMYRGFTPYYRATFRVRCRNDGLTWQPSILNAGCYQLLGTPFLNASTLIPCFSGTFPVSQPVPLDVNGRQMTVQQLKDDGPNYISFRTYPSADLNDLITDSGP